MIDPTAAVLASFALLMAVTLANFYLGGSYVCPRCGARTEGGHSPDCPWSRSSQ